VSDEPHVEKAPDCEQLRHRSAIGDVDLLESEGRKSLELGNGRRLQAGIVIGVEIIDADDLIALCEQAARDMPMKPAAPVTKTDSPTSIPSQ
jgi:hypothetical protein